MNYSIITTTALNEHVAMISDAISDGRLTADNYEDMHNIVFNSDYFIVGYYNASQWLAKHNIDAFDAIEFVQAYETDNYGEVMTPIDSESIVNMFSYIVGEYAVSEVYADNFSDLVKNCEGYLL